MSQPSFEARQEEVRVSSRENGEDIPGRGNNLDKQPGVTDSMVCLWDVNQFIMTETEINQ